MITAIFSDSDAACSFQPPGAKRGEGASPILIGFNSSNPQAAEKVLSENTARKVSLRKDKTMYSGCQIHKLLSLAGIEPASKIFVADRDPTPLSET